MRFFPASSHPSKKGEAVRLVDQVEKIRRNLKSTCNDTFVAGRGFYIARFESKLPNILPVRAVFIYFKRVLYTTKRNIAITLIVRSSSKNGKNWLSPLLLVLEQGNDVLRFSWSKFVIKCLFGCCSEIGHFIFFNSSRHRSTIKVIPLESSRCADQALL